MTSLDPPQDSDWGSLREDQGYLRPSSITSRIVSPSSRLPLRNSRIDCITASASTAAAEPSGTRTAMGTPVLGIASLWPPGRVLQSRQVIRRSTGGFGAFRYLIVRPWIDRGTLRSLEPFVGRPENAGPEPNVPLDRLSIKRKLGWEFRVRVLKSGEQVELTIERQESA
jgi:hypothetical protein